MSKLRTVGRFLFGIPMFVFGAFHFMNASAMAGMVPIPGGVFWMYLTGAAFIAAAIAILANKMAPLAATLLGVMILIFLLSIHLPGVIGAESQQAMQSSMVSLLKDTVIAGGAWFMAGTLADDESSPGGEAASA